MTILVTGSAGFIGYHTSLALLARGETVIGFDDLNNYYSPKLKQDRNALLLKYPNYQFIRGSLEDISSSLSALPKKIDAICHLAAQAGVRYSLTNPHVYEASNLNGFLNVLELARHQSVPKIVFASSSSVYGQSPMPATGYVETQTTTQPVSLYGATKIANESMAYSYHHLFKIKMIGLRFFSVYGPWGRPDMAYYSFCDALTHNQPIEVFNHGQMSRDFTYIDEIVTGLLASLDAGLEFEIINLGNSQPVPLLKMVEILADLLDTKAKIDFKPLQSGDVIHTYANIDKARKMLGFSARTDLRQGLEKFVAWYQHYTR